jgi:DNA-binding CsgD family transcriptional regulator
LSDAHFAFRSELDRSLTAARERGHHRVAEILSRTDMLGADQIARLLGTTRMTINTKRRNHQLLGLDGATRGFRFPEWQIGEDGKPFEALPALFDRLGGSPWAVYRFLVQHHAELSGLTGREALAKGRSAEAIEAAESVANAFS